MNKHLTDTQLDHIEQAASAADQGVPWHVQNGARRGESIIAAQGNNTAGTFTVNTIAERILDQPTATYLATMDPAVTRQLVTEIKELRARIEAVREIHTSDWPGVCVVCAEIPETETDGAHEPWPCPTIKALGGES